MRAIERAVKLVGGQVKMAQLLGISQPAVSHVVRLGKDVPVHWCKLIEKATKGKVKRRDLRPDLYD